MTALTTEYENLVHGARLAAGVHVASFTLLVLDCFITFPDEVRYIWSSRWSVVKILYLVARYMAFIDGIIGLIYDFYPRLNPELCHRLDESQSWLILLGLAISETIMAFRTYALFQRDSRLTRFLLLSVGPAASVSVVVVRAVKNVGNSGFVQPLDPRFTPCMSTEGEREDWIGLLLLASFEAITLLLTVLKMGARVPRASLLYVFYRDGLVYFLVSITSSVVNIIFLLRNSINIITLQRVLHSNLSARIILHLRASDASTDIQSGHQLSSMRYAEQRSPYRSLVSNEAYSIESSNIS